jgi:hypothetical protein
VGGVATEDQLKQQLRIDNEIRDKITNALTRQLSFEKTITGVYANLTAEEDTLHRKIDTLHLQMKRDRALQGKIMALLQVALTDIQDLEDTLEVLWTGLPNFRHSARLAAQAALSFTPHLTLVNFTHQTSGIRILYQAYLYKEIDARTTDCNTYLVVATDEHSYALHPGHLPSLPITDRDSLLFSRPCPECALLVHLSGDLYKVVQGGRVTCTDGPNQLILGDRFTILPNSSCWNDLFRVDTRRLASKQYMLDLSFPDLSVDQLILQKDLSSGSITLGETSMASKRHHATDLKLHKDIQMAEQDLDTFLKDTQLQLDLSYGYQTTDYITWGVLGSVALIVLLISLTILWKCYSNRSSNNTVILPMSTMSPA